MPLADDYTDLAALRDFRRIRNESDTVDDDVMSLAISAASRSIDGHCDRPFGQEDTPSARTFTWAGQYLDVPAAPGYRGYLAALEVTDIATSAGLVVKTDADGDGAYETTISAAQYRLWPLNAAADGEPYTHIVLTAEGAATYPWRLGGVEVTATWGWPAVPASVTEACLLQANRLCGRRDSWSGVAGSPELGNELRLLSKLDPDLGPLLSRYRRMWVAA
ncbi:MAG TPA: hypothetical protein VHL53_16050 [Acidimicrobiia bacterium]|nr:hypothetical protein [Acidimicrobiia bacterium]